MASHYWKHLLKYIGFGGASTLFSQEQTFSPELACISHHPTAEARHTAARTSLRLLAVLNVLSSTPARAKRLAPRPDGPLTHFASPRGEKCRLELERQANSAPNPR